MKIKRKHWLLGAALLLGIAGTAPAASPPGLVNYQGVLRDAMGAPLNQTVDMTLRLYDADGGLTCVGGTLLLTDDHLQSGTGDVVVTDGLFNVELGGGSITAGTESTLAEVFRDNATVYMEVEIDDGVVTEPLCPRIRAISAAYSLNSDTLDGLDEAQFLRSDASDTGTGQITFSTTSNPGVKVGDNSTGFLQVGGSTISDVGGDLTLESDTGSISATDSLSVVGNLSATGVISGFNVTSGLDPGHAHTGPSVGGPYVRQSGDSMSGNLLMNNSSVSSAERLTISDPGPGEGVSWNATAAGWSIDVTPVNRANVDGNLNFFGTANDVVAWRPLYERSGGVSHRVWNAGNDGSGSGLDADDLDGLDGAQLLRSDVSDSFSGPLLSFGGGSQVDMAAGSPAAPSFYFGGDSDTGMYQGLADNVQFTTGGTFAMRVDQSGDLILADRLFLEGQTSESLGWDIADNRFEFTDDLALPGSLLVGSASAAPVAYSRFGTGLTNSGGATPLSSSLDLLVSDELEVNGASYLDGDLRLGGEFSGDDDAIYFDFQTTEFLQWDDSETRFELSDELAVGGVLSTGTNVAAPVSYNRFRAGATSSGALGNDGDLLVTFDLEVGASLALSRIQYMEGQTSGSDADQVIYFFNDGARDDVQIRWDDVRADPVCTGTASTEEAMIFGVNNTSPTASHGWYFMDDWDNVAFPQDIEVKIDATGSIAADGSITGSGACDVAETFLGPDLAPGTVVVIDPDGKEAVIPSSNAYVPAVGVVSTRPGLLLNGATADAYPKWAELDQMREQLANMPRGTMEVTSTDEQGMTVVEVVDDPTAAESASLRAALGLRAQELEFELDAWTRGNVAVALVGRVPVSVDGSYGNIRKGDYLTTSDTPGHAMLLDRSGPYLGMAMEDFSGGRGQILVFLTQGWYMGPAGTTVFDAAAAGSALSPEGDAPATEPVVTVAAGVTQVSLGTAGDGRFSILKGGEDSGDPGSEVFRVDAEGNVFSKGAFRPSAMDLAEYFAVGEPVEIGDVLVADRNDVGRLALGRQAADSAVVGVVSSDPGVLLGSDMTRIAAADPKLAQELALARSIGDAALEATVWHQLETKFERTHAAVALSGTVRVKVDAGFGAIAIGDALMTSPTPGHAMRADDPQPMTVIGKALEPLETGSGTIRMLVMMR